MKCSRCADEAVIFQKASGAALCRRHLTADIESRAKKEIRNKGGISSGERIYIRSSSPVKTLALRIFLSALFLKRSDIVFVREASAASLIITDETLDDTAADLLEAVLNGTVSSYVTGKTPETRTISPLSVIPDEEIVLYAQHHGWKQEVPQETGETRLFLTRFSEERPSAKFALKNTADKLKEICK
ncbi:MAG TPA: hypothetical protein O0X19_05615 [Methanocorpusculum sp.]|nr:hypothetical protein [Candidatus Methanocorpusculum equi]MCQ2357198.1 hypothetical protein [Methanocorpusculum sp.]HJJ33832.1 hypothetical protein [Methanocorpusculum sp.]HJJ57940.1 hypothetical protein [Methanocorpusculum sp.]HJJ59336.1 hypothetical protein [Methanocorpusculum sp.]